MRKVLYIFGQLDDSDVDWLAGSGRRQALHPGHILIREGEAAPDLHIVIDGTLDVSVDGRGAVARLRAGEIIGEMSFVDSAPPAATVSVLTNAVLFSISKRVLEDKIEDDPGFGCRLYKALAMFLADRLRNAQAARGVSPGLPDPEAGGGELDARLLDAVVIAGDRFRRLANTVVG